MYNIECTMYSVRHEVPALHGGMFDQLTNLLWV